MAEIPDYFPSFLNGSFNNFLFLPAGYPTPERFIDIVVELSIKRQNGTIKVDALEVGIPFSDPIADGPVIEEAYQKSQSEHGIDSCVKVLQLLEQGKAKVLKETVGVGKMIPIILMGYMNTFFEIKEENANTGQFDLRDNWGSLSKSLNIRHCIITDCTAQHISIGCMEAALYEEAGISLIPVISGNVDFQTVLSSLKSKSPDDVVNRKIVYCTAYLGVTGRSSTEVAAMPGNSAKENDLKYAEGMKLFRKDGHFILVGFGITNGSDINGIREKFGHTPNACVVGTAFVKAITKIHAATDAAANDRAWRGAVFNVIEMLYNGYECSVKVKEIAIQGQDGDAEASSVTDSTTSSSATDSIQANQAGRARGARSVAKAEPELAPKLKVCGFTSFEQVSANLIDGVDLFGFNFYEKSPRYCLSTGGGESINSVMENLSKSINSIRTCQYHLESYNPKSVAVVSGPSGESIKENISHALNNAPGIDIIQMHMSEEVFFSNTGASGYLKPFVNQHCPDKQYIFAISTKSVLSEGGRLGNHGQLSDKLSTAIAEMLVSSDKGLYGILIDCKVGDLVGGTGQPWDYETILKDFYVNYLSKKQVPKSKLKKKFLIAGGITKDSFQNYSSKTYQEDFLQKLSQYVDVVFDTCSGVEKEYQVEKGSSGVEELSKDSNCPSKDSKSALAMAAFRTLSCRRYLRGVDVRIPSIHKSSEKIRELLRILKPCCPLFFGVFGGAWVSQLILAACKQLEEEYCKCRKTEEFWVELNAVMKKVANRPTPLYECNSLQEFVRGRVNGSHLTDEKTRASDGKLGARIFLKREDLVHTGAHKINNAIFQIIMAKNLGKTRIICETGAGQHGVACATVCAMLGGLKCRVYMGAKDAERQILNVRRIESMGAELFAVQTGERTLRSAINETMRDWATNIEDTHYVIGSAVGPSPFPYIVKEAQSVISYEARKQILEQTGGKLPKAITACVGGGSNCIGIFDYFIQDKGVNLVGAEAAGHCYSHFERENRNADLQVCKHVDPSTYRKNKLTNSLHDSISNILFGPDATTHSSSLTKGTMGILHGSTSLMLQSKKGGQSGKTHSISAGLDYSGVSPLHSFLMQINRATYASCSDIDAIRGWSMLSKKEGIICALETAHAVTVGIELASELPQDECVIINLSGRGDKDMVTLEKQSRVMETVEKIEELREYMLLQPREYRNRYCKNESLDRRSTQDDSVDARLRELAKAFLVDADLEIPCVEAVILNFFADFLSFVETLEDKLPDFTQAGFCQRPSGSDFFFENNWLPARDFAPNLYKMVDLLLAFREVLINHFAIPFDINDGSVSDLGCIVGTGGDGGKNPYNISTPATLLAAAACNNCTNSGVGVTNNSDDATTPTSQKPLKVLKYGNVSSAVGKQASGAADVIGEFGANLTDVEMADPDCIRDILGSCNYAFLFARMCFPLMKKFGPIRAKFAAIVKAENGKAENHSQMAEGSPVYPVVTIFNFLGPIINPSSPTFHVFGVSNRKMSQVYAMISAKRGVFQGCKRVLVCHNVDGIDKVLPESANVVFEMELSNNWETNLGGSQEFNDIRISLLEPEHFGMKSVASGTIIGSKGIVLKDNEKQCIEKIFGVDKSDAASLHNAMSILRILKSHETPGSIPQSLGVLKDFIVMNGALLVYLKNLDAANFSTAGPQGSSSIKILQHSVKQVELSLSAGTAAEQLDRFVYFSNHHAFHTKKKKGSNQPVGQGIVDRICKSVSLHDCERILRCGERKPSSAPAGTTCCKLSQALSTNEKKTKLIPELKYRSPSVLQTADEKICKPEDIVEDYLYAIGESGQANPIAAISVLTEPVFFGGSIEKLKTVKNVVKSTAGSINRSQVSVLMKDFFLTKEHILMAKQEADADCVLFIVALREFMEASLPELMAFAYENGLEPILEVVSVEEADYVAKYCVPVTKEYSDTPIVVGINNRDLRTFEMDLSRTPRILAHFQKSYSTTQQMDREVALVSFSGISTGADIQKIRKETGNFITSFLVGTHLMQCESSGKRKELIQELVVAQPSSGMHTQQLQSPLDGRQQQQLANTLSHISMVSAASEPPVRLINASPVMMNDQGFLAQSMMGFSISPFESQMRTLSEIQPTLNQVENAFYEAQVGDFTLVYKDVSDTFFAGVCSGLGLGKNTAPTLLANEEFFFDIFEKAFIKEEYFTYFDYNEKSLVFLYPDKIIETFESDPAGAIEQELGKRGNFVPIVLSRNKNKKADEYPPFLGGVLGYYGFENIANIEPSIKLPPREDTSSNLDAMPLNVFGVYNTFLVRCCEDAREDQTSLRIYTVLQKPDTPAGGSLEQAYANATLRIEEYGMRMRKQVEQQLSKSTSNVSPNVSKKPASFQPPSRDPEPNLDVDGYSSNFAEAEFKDMVVRLKIKIQQGDFFQCVPSRRLTKETEASANAIFQELLKLSASSPFKYYVRSGFDRAGDQITIIGASPELLVSVESVKVNSAPQVVSTPRASTENADVSIADASTARYFRKVSTCPIAGTRPRGKDRQHDIDLGLDLLQDEKELAEHVMLVDLARNDIGKVCKNVQTEEYQRIRYYQNVSHICSRVSGVMKVAGSSWNNPGGVNTEKDAATALDALKAIFPAGTLSGGPKIIAVQNIVDNEKGRRNMYGGGIGFVNFGNTMAMCIGIRSLVYKSGSDQNRDFNRIFLQAGAGIVWDSVPQSEYDETTHKMRNLKLAVKKGEQREEQIKSGKLSLYSSSGVLFGNRTSSETIVRFSSDIAKKLSPAQERIYLDALADEVHLKLGQIRQMKTGKPALSVKELFEQARGLELGQLMKSTNPENLRILVIDNYCSFTHNIFQLIAETITDMLVLNQSNINESGKVSGANGSGAKDTATSPGAEDGASGSVTDSGTYAAGNAKGGIRKRLLKTFWNAAKEFLDPNGSWWRKQYETHEGHDVFHPTEGHDRVNVVRNNKLTPIIEKLKEKKQYGVTNGKSHTAHGMEEKMNSLYSLYGYSHVIIGPGPKHPKDLPKEIGDLVNICMELGIPVLGICLGHQFLVEHFGGKVVVGPEIMHGKVSDMVALKDCVWDGCQNPSIMRYHSLVADTKTFPNETLDIIGNVTDVAPDQKGTVQTIMAVKHKTEKIYGMQFHPDSIGTQDGRRMFANFLRL